MMKQNYDNTGRGVVRAGSILKEIVTNIEESYKNLNSEMHRCAIYNRLLGEIDAGKMTVIAARPGMGKSILAFNIALDIACQENVPVLYFATEMSKSSLTYRMLASLGRIPLQRLHSGGLQDEDWSKLTSAINMLDEMPLYIDDTMLLTPELILQRCHELKKYIGRDLQLVIIDTVHDVHEETENKQKLGVPSCLRRIAREQNVPMIVTANVSRAVEYRRNKCPVLSDVNKPETLDRVADDVLFLYRESVYNQDAPIDRAEITTHRRYDGITRRFNVGFSGETQSFEGGWSEETDPPENR